MSGSIFRRALLVPAVAMALFIGGCDKGPSGVYQVEGAPGMTVEFNSGKVIFAITTPLGSEKNESTFTVEGDKVNIAKDPDGKPVTFTINKDGSLSGPGGMKLVKK